MSTDKNPDYASAAAVTGLAREVEALRGKLDRLAEMPGRIKDLARIVTQLSAEVATAQGSGGAAERTAAPSWLDNVSDESVTRQWLDDLCEWMQQVYLRYADAARVLPDCWLWHPDVVEELTWLMQVWIEAYRGDNATALMAADWHDRYRPGVVRRIRELTKNCSLENHVAANRPPTVAPLMDDQARALIAGWWGSSPQAPAPEPTAEQLAEAAETDLRPQWGGRR